MITITDNAKKGLKKILDEKGEGDLLGLRLKVNGGMPGAYHSDFRLVKTGSDSPEDIILDQGDFKVYIDPESAPKLKGVKIDLVPTFRGPSFKIEYPTPKWDDPLANRVQDLVTNRINPGVAAHGGYVTLLDVKDSVVYLSFGGGCQGCGLTDVTLKKGIEVMIKNEIPEIRAIVDQTDHDQGTNPYYQPSGLGQVEGQSPLVS